MTITTEDGTGLPLANSYAAIATADAFHALRGNTAWARANATEKASALVRATDYIDTNHRAPKGPLVAEQGLSWPVEAAQGVPAAVVKATILLALYALAGPLQRAPERGVKSQTKSLEGVGSTSTVYDDAAPTDPYPDVSTLLAPITTSVGGLIIGRLTR